jgi:hypothetical protein
MNQFYVKRSEYVEINVPPTSVNQTIYFPDLPNLRDTKTWGISAYNAQSLATAQSGNDVISPTQSKVVLVFLYFENGLFISQPLFSFINVDPTQNYYQLPVMLAGQKITWSKSYVQITDTATIAGFASHSFVFNVYYSLN